MEKNIDRSFEWQQFARLGDMIGDGLHHEDKWILKEYKRLQKILIGDCPEVKKFKKSRAQEKNQTINLLVKKRLEQDKCPCGSHMQQSRSGSLVVKCTSCPKKFKYKLINKK